MTIDCIVHFLRYRALLKIERFGDTLKSVEIVDVDGEHLEITATTSCFVKDNINISSYGWTSIKEISIFNANERNNNFTLFATKNELLIIGKDDTTNSDEPSVMIYINSDQNKDSGTNMKAIYNQIAHKHEVELTTC